MNSMKHYVGCIPPVLQTAFVRSNFKNIGDYAILFYGPSSQKPIIVMVHLIFFALRPDDKQLRSCREGKLS